MIKSWILTSRGDTHLLSTTDTAQMIMLVRSKRELFTDFIEREAKSRDLKVVINGSFTDLSFGSWIAVMVTDSTQNPGESTPVGKVIQEGKLLAGGDSPGKFNFSQETCGAQRFTVQQGNPSPASCSAIGGIAPIVIDGLPYGSLNAYRAGVPANAPQTGDVGATWLPFLAQKGNSMFAGVLKRGDKVGKTALGYSKAKGKLVILVQADNTAGDNANEVRTRLLAQDVDSAVFLDCSDSATLYYDGKFLVSPGRHKNEYLTVAVGFK